jgi:2-polyprenyl-6-hydroxyphenyl methylase/3-demethylubiquinone-9 3-methyltransferase
MSSGADAHEIEVASRFDRFHSRFRRDVGSGDVRLRALQECLEPLAGRRILDLGCGKGRFARQLSAAGAQVVGVDRSAAMLAEAVGLDRARASARRLPFADGAFEAVVAVEVFEHLPAIDVVLREVHRVLRPGGVIAVVDKNAGSWNARRPWLPNLALKWLDEKRGRWMYPSGGPVRERWFWPEAFRKQFSRWFVDVRVAHLLSPDEEDWPLFRQVPGARLMTLWTARVAEPGGEPR